MSLEWKSERCILATQCAQVGDVELLVWDNGDGWCWDVGHERRGAEPSEVDAKWAAVQAARALLVGWVAECDDALMG